MVQPGSKHRPASFKTLICWVERELGDLLVCLLFWFLNSLQWVSWLLSSNLTEQSPPTPGRGESKRHKGRGMWLTQGLSLSWFLFIGLTLPFENTKESHSTFHGNLFIYWKRALAYPLNLVQSILFPSYSLDKPLWSAFSGSAAVCHCLLNVVTSIEHQNSSGSDQPGDSRTTPASSPHVYLVTRLKMSLTSLETPAPENSQQKPLKIFLHLLGITVVTMTKINLPRAVG